MILTLKRCWSLNMPTNDHEMHQTPGPHDTHRRDDESPGYETTDVNAGGVAVFLAGLFGFVLVFFVFCFVMGKVINSAIEKSDGPPTKWNKLSAFAGAETTNGKRQDLASNPEMQQKEFQQMTATFPEPRLDTDDGNQATADLHAREDLLLNYYSTDKGTTRIPIGAAMALIAQRGLGAAPAASTTTLMAGDSKPEIHAPLTMGFARTGYELDTIEKREQQNQYTAAERAREAK